MRIVALLLALTQVSGQSLVFPGSVDLVQVVVSVSAKDGGVVRDLEAKDFVIRDNGKPVAIETFLRMQDAAGSDRLPVEVALLLDTSSSMTAELTRARDAIVDFTRAVPSFARGRIVAFDRDAYDRNFDAQSIKPVLDQMIQMEGGAGTRTFDAVIDGASLISKQPGRRVMVLFTDGEDATSRRSLKDAVKALQEAEVTCYVVSYSSRLAGFTFGGEPDKGRIRDAQRSLEALALESGGFVVDGTSPDVVAQLKRIVDDIASSYVIGFTGALTKKAEHRRLRVEVARRDLTVRHREGYDTKAR
ncbi:MAG: VWA domain-containing protein [Vicinamibacteria bacterium]